MTLSRALVCVLACALTALQSGCAQVPAKESPSQAASASQDQPAPNPETKPSPALPPQDLTPQLLYEYLVAEMAVSRQEFGLAAKVYVELARKTRDPRIARRATGVAAQARQGALAVEAATIWLQADPTSIQARQTLASILISSGALQDVRPHLELLLGTDPAQTAQIFLQINNLLAHHADKAAVAGVVKELAALHPKVPEAHLAVAQAYWNAGQPDGALAGATEALKRRPDWELAALFRMQVLQRRSNAEAVNFGRGYLRSYPGAKDIRLNLVRLLIADQKKNEARREIQALAKAHPEDAAVALTVGLLAVQIAEWPLAETHLMRVLDLDPAGNSEDTVRFYLGQVTEEQKRADEALRWYQSVTPGEQYLPAQGRIANLLAKQGKVVEARALLQAQQPQNLAQRVQLTQFEAAILRDIKAHKETFDLLAQALQKLPDTPELLYDYAMAAEKVDRLDVLETSLRRLIELRPDHAHAYNALGYTLAERTDRLQEALVLIDQALKLAPDDPYIQDSMGWVLYRLGRVPEAQAYLQKAFERKPDPEIAAHLGEVLWVQGQRDEARRIWNAALAAHPENEVLRAVLKKFLQ